MSEWGLEKIRSYATMACRPYRPWRIKATLIIKEKVFPVSVPSGNAPSPSPAISSLWT